MDISLRHRFMPSIQQISLVKSKDMSLSPHRQNKNIKFNNKYSFYDFKNSSKATDPSAKETKGDNEQKQKTQFHQLQQMVHFTDYSEFDVIQAGKVIMSIKYAFNPNCEPAKKNEECQERFTERLNEVIESINRRFPFIELLIKNDMDKEELQNKFKNGLFEVQICSNLGGSIDKKIIYSKNYLKVLPTSKQIIDNIRLSLKTCNLQIQVDCLQKDVKVEGKQFDNSQFDLKDLVIAIRQKDPSQFSANGWSLNDQSQLSICTSFVSEKSAFQSFLKTNDLKQVTRTNINLCNSPKSVSQSFFNNSSINRSFSNQKVSPNVTKQQKSPANQILENQGSKKTAVKLYSQKKLTDANGIVKFNDLIYEVGNYEIQIYDKMIKTYTQTINLKEMINQQNSTDIKLNTFVERDDLTKCEIIVKCEKDQQKKPVLTIGNYEFYQKNQAIQSQQQQYNWMQQISSQDIDLDDQETKYIFYLRPGNYFMEVQMPGAFTDQRPVHLKKGEFSLNIDLTPQIEAEVTLSVKNLLTRETIQGVNLQIECEKEKLNLSGVTSEFGKFSFKLALLNKFKVSLEREKYLKVFYNLAVSSKHVAKDNSFDLFLIPQKNQDNPYFGVYIYIPHQEFRLNFQLKDKQGNIINSANRKNVYNETKQGQNKLIEIMLQNPNQQDMLELSASSQLVPPNVHNLKEIQNPERKLFTQPEVKEDNQKCNKKQLCLDDDNLVCKAQDQQPDFFKTYANGSQGLFCKSVQNASNAFIKSRVYQQNSNQLKGQSTNNVEKSNQPKQFLYLNEKVKQYSPDQSAIVYLIANNQVLDIQLINQNILITPQVFGVFDVNQMKLKNNCQPEIITIDLFQKKKVNNENNTVIQNKKQIQPTKSKVQAERKPITIL